MANLPHNKSCPPRGKWAKPNKNKWRHFQCTLRTKPGCKNTLETANLLVRRSCFNFSLQPRTNTNKLSHFSMSPLFRILYPALIVAVVLYFAVAVVQSLGQLRALCTLIILILIPYATCKHRDSVSRSPDLHKTPLTDLFLLWQLWENKDFISEPRGRVRVPRAIPCQMTG